MGAVIQTVQSKNTSFPQGTQFCSWLGALLGPALQGKPPQLNFSSFVQAVKLCPKLRARTGGRWRRHPPWGQNWRRHQETQKSRKYYFNAVFVKINTNAKKKKKKTIFWWWNVFWYFFLPLFLRGDSKPDSFSLFMPTSFLTPITAQLCLPFCLILF